MPLPLRWRRRGALRRRMRAWDTRICLYPLIQSYTFHLVNVLIGQCGSGRGRLGQASPDCRYAGSISLSSMNALPSVQRLRWSASVQPVQQAHERSGVVIATTSASTMGHRLRDATMVPALLDRLTAVAISWKPATTAPLQGSRLGGKTGSVLLGKQRLNAALSTLRA